MTAREIALDGGSPWGFRMHGGADVLQPLRISRVNPGSKAAAKGIREGDIITSINGENTRDKTNSEAHALLKGAGNALKLGLNQDCSGGSPKKRQYNNSNRGAQQETHSETIKRSNITTTTYIVSSNTTTTSSNSTTAKNRANSEGIRPNTISANDRVGSTKDNNEFNGIKINGESKLTAKDYFSDRSTISSNYSSAASTPSTLTEYQGGDSERSSTDVEDSASVMSDDNATNSRPSRRQRRRSKNNRRKGKETVDENKTTVRPTTPPAFNASADSERLCDKIEDISRYRVESPKTVPAVAAAARKGSIGKSRSLDDDDDQVKIQELSESSGEAEIAECNAIVAVVEADSEDVQWSITADLTVAPRFEHVRAMTTETLKLEERMAPEIISPEDESNLRYFLEGLELVSSPEEAALKTAERETAETIRARRAKKREELAQYFLPVYQNPRFLDVISEEGSDGSDRERPGAPRHPKYENFAPTARKAFLTETDAASVPLISDTCTTILAEEASDDVVEIVYLENDSDSDEESDEEVPTIPPSQLTPPPTPDDASPKNELDADFIRKIATLTTDDQDRGRSGDTRFKSLPGDFPENLGRLGSTEGVRRTTLTPDDDRERLGDTRFESLPGDFPQKLRFPGSTEGVPELPVRQTTLTSDDDREGSGDTRFKSLPGDFPQKQGRSGSTEGIPKPPVRRTNVLSPSILSDCSWDSSSRGTSMCTAICKEDETMVPHLLTLKEICLNKLISLPFGKDVLEELASVSRSLQDLTNNLSSRKHVVEYYHHHHHHSNNHPHSPPPASEALTRDHRDHLIASTNTSFDLVSAKTAMPERAKDKWVGMPSEDDPQLVVCLSPTQKSFLETTRKVPDEAAKLLDLHEKFARRRQCHENDGVDESGMSNRLLAIIRRQQQQTGGVGVAVDPPKSENPDDYLYYVEKGRPGVVARSNSLEDGTTNDSVRLQTHNLSEWLRLARDKSKSDSHLNVFDDTEGIVAVNLPKISEEMAMRRRSLPQEIYVQQMQYLIQKEKEIQRELEKLEEEKRKLTYEMDTTTKEGAIQRRFDPTKYHISKNEDIAIHSDELQPKSPSKSTPPSTERFRQDMYDEYMTQIAKRQDRQQNKVIKITTHQLQSPPERAGDKLEVTHVKGIEDEFMTKVKQLKEKYGLDNSNSEDADYAGSLDKSDDAEDSEPVLVMDGDQLSEAKKLPKHLKEFVDIARQAAGALDKDAEDGIWSPGQRDVSSPDSYHRQTSQELDRGDEAPPPIWTPKSAGSSPSLERKEFRPVNFESPILGRRYKSDGSTDATPVDPPWRSPVSSSDIGIALSSSLEKRIPNSFSSPIGGFSDFPSPRLPKAQNPTITLLQKARGGHLPKGAAYIEQGDDPIHRLKHDSPPKIAPGEIVYEIRNEYTSESESERPKKMADLTQRKYPAGIGPTTKDGMPLTLRSEVRDQNQSKWYKRMYDTIHKQKPRYDDEYITVRYKQRRGRYPYISGYLSEPEPGAYDSDASIYDHRLTPLDRRRTQPATSGGGESYTTSYTMPRSSTNSYAPQSTVVRHGKDIYKNQPGRIENYVPGHSSISDKEAKEWWDEVMDIFDGWLADHSALPSYNLMLSRAVTRNHLEQQKQTPGRGHLSQALKESGYESDSTLVFRRRDEAINQLSPSEQREAYRTIQRGGDVPLHGLRKLAPERPKDDLNIEYIPISPNLTRIRVHKNNFNGGDDIGPAPQLHAYPVFGDYKRTAPSTFELYSTFPPRPPSPPKRKSSRNNSTLRLISTMKVSGDKPTKRHETCFTSTADLSKSNVKFLRDKITCKLSPVPRRKGEARLRVTKTLTANPELKSKLTTSLSALKDPKTSSSRIYSKTVVSSDKDRCCLPRSSSTGSVRKMCKACSILSQSKKPSAGKSDEFKPSRPVSLDRAFGSEKGKVDLPLPKSTSDRRLIKSPDLVSPTEVKKASVLTQNPQKSSTKHSKAVVSSVRNGLRSPSRLHEIPIKVSITGKGKEVLQVGKGASSKSRSNSASPAPSAASDKSKLSRSTTSLDSLRSSKSKKDKVVTVKKSLRDSFSKKAKKDQLNDEIVKKEKKSSDGIPRTPRNLEFSEGKTPITLSEIKRQKENVQTDSSFFQHLFLRDAQRPKSMTFANNSWITEKTLALQRRTSSVSEPTIGALKIYLNHTKPVSDSKFRTMDAQLVRSRSVSPKNVRWEDEGRTERQIKRNVGYERSSSLPPKLVFTETTRPVSPIIRRRRQDTESRTRTTVRPPSPQKLIFTETTRPVSPIIKRRPTFREKDRITFVGPRSYLQRPVENLRAISPEIRSRSASPRVQRLGSPTVERFASPRVERRASPRVERQASPRVERLASPRIEGIASPKMEGLSSPRGERFTSTRVGRLDSARIEGLASPRDGRLASLRVERPVPPRIEKLASPRVERPASPETLYFSQTTRPVSPVVEPKRSVEDITETVVKSPSYRKIRSLHGGSETVDFVKRRIPRSRSASETDGKQLKRIDYDPPSLTQSTSSIDSLREYQTYVKEVIHSAKKSDRFKDLNKFYSAIERLGELERTTSSADLRPRRRNEEEIIDYDRWKEVRCREKAERELDAIYRELKETQKQKDFLFVPKQVETYRWRRDFDRGLRIKEKSVEDIKEEFERMTSEESGGSKPRLEYRKDVYKPLWRGNSVANLAQSMGSERRSQSEGRGVTTRQKRVDSERLLTEGIGSRIWSSLSMEQVNVLKHQLAEIYQNGSKKTQKPEYSVEVPEHSGFTTRTLLKVRRNSDSSKSMEQKRSFVSDSTLSETDKMRLSQTLSKEVLERQRHRYRTSLSLVLGKETRGAIAAADAKVRHPEPPSPRTCYSLEMSEDGDRDKKRTDGDFLLVLAKSDTANKANIKETLTEWAQPKKPLVSTDVVNVKTSSTSETESGSTDGSTKTVICAGTKDVVNQEDVKKKVQYFEEKVQEKDDYTPTVHKPAESSSPEDQEETEEVPRTEDKSPSTQASSLRRSPLSKSYQDFKELFGEIDSAKMPSPVSNAASTSTASLAYSSDSLYRSRSLSPHPDVYYFSLLKSGDVHKLRDKFEKSHRFPLGTRRCNSDPQLHEKSQIYIPGQIAGGVDNLRRRYEFPAFAGRGRSRIRRGGVVSPVHLKAEDRFMPHINIISKIASLYPRKSARKDRSERSTEELADILGITVGEVKKLREKFDSPERRNVSLLGHMFTSSPNLHELRDIAPYLTASWTAHKYSKKEDNARPLTPPVPPPSKSPPIKKRPAIPRPKSASPTVRDKVKLSSILKGEEVKKKEFDPKVHRPIRRYQPPAPKIESPSRYRACSAAMSTTQYRPTVTFKEPDAPIPPPKGQSRKPTETESPRKYVENDVTIHYRTPVRQEIKEAVSEDELQRRQAEHMKKIYQEERRRKYLQVSHSLDELQDMNSRRHADNFIPSQKSPIPLNRYDDFVDDFSPKLKPRPRSPEPRLVAKALYNFVGQSARELTFRKGDIIYIRRQVDKNWYEGEHNAMVGLFPANYVEIVPYDGVKSTVRKPHEGQARAKYNFIAQTHLELSLAKGELVVVTRRVDDNWFEGKIGGRKGIFPVSYVEILIDPTDPPQVPPAAKPVAAPAAHSLLLNGSLGGKESMGTHKYVPPYHGNDTAPSYRAKPVQMSGGGTYGSLSRGKNLNQALHIDTQSDPIPYRALYKYKPQNEDELELLEGDTVYVLEKCDDGWFVGSSDRTGAFGTFPGNYVERI